MEDKSQNYKAIFLFFSPQLLNNFLKLSLVSNEIEAPDFCILYFLVYNHQMVCIYGSWLKSIFLFLTAKRFYIKSYLLKL